MKIVRQTGGKLTFSSNDSIVKCEHQKNQGFGNMMDVEINGVWAMFCLFLPEKHQYGKL